MAASAGRHSSGSAPPNISASVRKRCMRTCLHICLDNVSNLSPVAARCPQEVISLIPGLTPQNIILAITQDLGIQLSVQKNFTFAVNVSGRQGLAAGVDGSSSGQLPTAATASRCTPCSGPIALSCCSRPSSSRRPS